MVNFERTGIIVKYVLKQIVDYFPKYELVTTPGQIVETTERMPWGPLFLVSLQHILAMFGSTVLCPMLMGFSPNTGLLFSGIGTLIFYVCTGGRVPSYVGTSFAFIGVVNAATGYHYQAGTTNQNIPVALGGMLVTGLIYLTISFITIFAGYRWLEILMPPIVTGAVVMSIGLNLVGSAIDQASASGFDAWFALCTVLSVCLVTMYAPGPFKRLPVLIGGIFSYVLYFLFGLGGYGPGINFQAIRDSKIIGAPPIHHPVFDGSAISLIAPVAIILVAENIGHVKAVGSTTGKSLDRYIGRAFLGDSLATILSVSCGGIGTTTYAENIGVMSITKIYSTLNFVIVGFIAIILGILPVFGAIIQSIPQGVFGGLSIVLFGMVAVTGARIWIENDINFSKPRNLLTAGVALVLGVGMVDGLVVTWGVIKIDGIGVATCSAIILYQLLREDWVHVFKYIIAKIKGEHYEFPQTQTDDDLEMGLHGDTPVPPQTPPTKSKQEDVELPVIGESDQANFSLNSSPTNINSSSNSTTGLSSNNTITVLPNKD